MFALCVESSHARGMGHLYRSMVLAEHLAAAGQRTRFVINDHAPALNVLQARGHAFDVVAFEPQAAWEAALVRQHGFTAWLNDRFATEESHAVRVKALGLRLATLDDRGDGAALADLHIAALMFEPERPLRGHRVLTGIDFLVLDPEIARYRRQRRAEGSLVVTLGGTDTYGATVTVVRLLAAAGRRATVVVGPGFQHHADLAAVTTPDFMVKTTVFSLIEEFSHHDVAITGGGVTAFEAAASGLPCIVVANERFEIPVGRMLEQIGAAVFAGHHSELDATVFGCKLPLEAMSEAGLKRVGLQGAQRVVDALLTL